MLPPNHKNEQYVFNAKEGDGFVVEFVSKPSFGRSGRETTLWRIEAFDRASLVALSRWLRVRRSSWSSWGALAKCAGFEAFDRHIRSMLAEKPPAFALGTTVQRLADDREMALGELMDGIGRPRVETLYVHRFSSHAARERMFEWLTQNFTRSDNFLRMAFAEGTDALALVLDEIGEPDLRARPHEKRLRGYDL